ncbi:hypothetical protein CC79DRAFT_686199 [Sarocladium strictum]
MTIFGIRDYIKDVFEIRRQPQPRDEADDWEPTYYDQPYAQGTQDPDEKISRSLRINLVICNVFVWIMFVAGVIECAFATLMQDDLNKDRKNDDGYESQCDMYYVQRGYLEDTTDKCNKLYVWTYIMIFAGSFSLVRTLMNVLPVHGQNRMTLQYQRGGKVDHFLTPSRSYAIRTFFSAMACILHLISAIMLGVSPVITDKEPAAIEYHIMYILCLSLVCAATVMTGQQTCATGLASWRLREPKETHTHEQEMEAPRPKSTGPFPERTFLNDMTLER